LAVFVVALDVDGYVLNDGVWDLDGHLYGHMHGVRYGLRHMHWNRAGHGYLDWNVDGVWYVLDNLVRDVLHDGNGNLNWNVDRVGLVNMNGVWVGNRYLNLLDDWNGVGLGYWDLNFFGDGHGLHFAVVLFVSLSSKSTLLTSETAVGSLESSVSTGLTASVSTLAESTTVAETTRCSAAERVAAEITTLTAIVAEVKSSSLLVLLVLGVSQSDQQQHARL
jgi:hypothetical protein